MSNKAECRYCGKPIIWIRSPKGHLIPCDPEEVPYKLLGKQKIVTKDGEVVAAEIVSDVAEADGFGYIAHFANCPTYRKAKKHGT